MARSATSQNATDGELQIGEPWIGELRMRMPRIGNPRLEKAQRPGDAREEKKAYVSILTSLRRRALSNPRHFQSEALSIIY